MCREPIVELSVTRHHLGAVEHVCVTTPQSQELLSYSRVTANQSHHTFSRDAFIRVFEPTTKPLEKNSDEKSFPPF
ncbi:hypothetical protein RRG08_045191 [Elysia crispata]|uniref:Uncharacterized protein n=1 Tax=Elysia crispata TaxID=231223 RepID=A0AAE1A2M0_9GAST|nr:hypothetical protein RRG08_045191 [Elysia crispata]